MHRFARASALAAALLGLAVAPAAASAAGTVIVQFRPGVAPAQATALLGGAEQVGTVRALDAVVVRTAGSTTALAARLGRSPLVAYAEPNRELRAFATPNDPRFRELYGLNNTGQTGGRADADVDAPEGWDLAGMAAFPATGGVKVGIVDSGIRLTHEDLTGKVVDCAQAYSGVTVLASSLREGTCADDNGHGTHVAGTISANANNSRGVAGVSFDSPLSICRALGGPLGSGSTSDVATCITYLADKGAKVINLSLGGGATTTLHNAVKYAVGKDALVVAAAGNDGDGTLNYPAAYPEAVSVAATDARDLRASYSNANADVEIAAPGSDVLSTIHSSNTAYGLKSGTSMASPHVAGVAAIIRKRNPAFTAAQTRAKLTASVDDLGTAGRDPVFGFGRVNLVKAAS